MRLDDEELQSFVDIPKAFIEAWCPQMMIVVNDKAASLVALGYLLAVTVGMRLVYLKQDRERDKKEETENDERATNAYGTNVTQLLTPMR